MQKSFFYQSILLLAITSSCISNDTTDPKPNLNEDYKTGVIVTNEGGFLANNASVSFFNTTTVNVTNYVFSEVNDQAKVGDVLQSAHYVDEHLYLLVNNSDKVIVTNDTFVHVATIENLTKPRYMVSKDGKGYITETVDYAEKGRLTILDLERRFISKTIAMDYQPEGLIIAGDYLFVSNQGADNLFVISLLTEEVVDTVDVGIFPSGMVLDSDGDVWVICTGSFSAEGDASIYEIDATSFEVKSSVALGLDPDGKIAVDNSGEVIFFYEGQSIFKFDTSDPQAPASPWITESEATGFYGIGFSPDNLVFLADAADFSEPGKVFFYNLSGVQISSFIAGIATNGFVFK
ncbi:MAG: YVTN family beta-propeller protein [Cyclobacteriaceae bacterium]|jgi:YVTN family beta-propeller protein